MNKVHARRATCSFWIFLVISKSAYSKIAIKTKFIIDSHSTEPPATKITKLLRNGYKGGYTV